MFTSKRLGQQGFAWVHLIMSDEASILSTSNQIILSTTLDLMPNMT